MFEELIEAIVNILGIGLFLLLFIAGGYVTDWLKKPLNRLADRCNRGYDPFVVGLAGKGIVTLLCLLVCLPAMPAFTEVLDAMMPIGDFREITGEFAESEGKWLINVLFNIFLQQYAQSFAYFIPFILVNLVLALAEKFLCREASSQKTWQLAVSYLADVVMLFAINALVLRTGLLFPRLAAALLQGYDRSAGLGTLIVLLIPALLLLFVVLRDLLSSELLMSIFGVNCTAAMMGLTPQEGNRWLFFMLAFGCSLAAKYIKRRIPTKDDSFRYDGICALLILLATGLLSWLVLQFV